MYLFLKSYINNVSIKEERLIHINKVNMQGKGTRNEVLGKGVHWSTWLPLDPQGAE